MKVFDVLKNATILTQMKGIYNTAISIKDGYARSVGKYRERDSLIESLNSYVHAFSHSNDYMFLLTMPDIPGFSSVPFGDELQVFVKSVSVPSTTLSEKITRVGAGRRSTLGVITTDNITLTLNDTNQNHFHTLFSVWQHIRESKEADGGGYIAYYPDQIKAEGSLFRGGNKIYGLEGMYPITVGDLRFDEESSNELQTFDVTLHVNHLKHFDKPFSVKA